MRIMLISLKYSRALLLIIRRKMQHLQQKHLAILTKFGLRKVTKLNS